MDLHAEKDAFTDIISGAARYFNISEIYIEKDYWVTLPQVSKVTVLKIVIQKKRQTSATTISSCKFF